MNLTKSSEKFSLWQRNVKDKYKDISTENIKIDLYKTALPNAVMMSQIEGDFNFSNVIRTANAFNIKDIFYYGKKKFDRRGAVGTYLYSNVTYLSSMEEIIELKKQYFFVGLENNISKPLFNINNYVWEPNSLIVIGEENIGISDEIIELCDHLVEIITYGSVRSLNAATAAAIAMNSLSSQLRK